MISKTAVNQAFRSLNRVKPRPAVIRFAGGLDLETPPLSVPSGYCRTAQNFECDVMGGYATVKGYERFDGRPAPSAATASVINITLTGAIAVGNTVTGVTSAATGVVIVVNTGSIVVTKITGTFVTAEVLNVAAAPQATTTSAAHGAATALLRAQYKNLAADNYRADIAPPTGSGNNLGGVRFSAVTYCFRNNAGGTAANLWKSTSLGWVQVTLYNEISFTVGAIAIPAEGATLTQGGVTATLKRLVLNTGTFAGGNAVGRLIITNPGGGNFAAGAATLTGGVTVTLSAVQTAITFLPSGRFEFKIGNFTGSTSTNRIYGCDGVNRGFEFDGTVLVPIATGMTTDTPIHLTIHKLHLFFSFGASVQHSAPGSPYVWSPIVGASEIGMGDTVTGFQPQPGSADVGALAIFCRNRLSILYGTSVANWKLIAYREELGAYHYTTQDVGYTMFLDDQGVTSIKTVQAFGNFAHAALSARMRSWVNAKRAKATASCVSRDKSQYRLFFSDGYALFTTFSGKQPAFMPIKLIDPATWAWSSEETDGSEVIYFGSTDGHVYQMEKGTSFDGDPIVHNIAIAWNWLGSPQLIKKFHDASIEVAGTGYSEFSFTYRVGYASVAFAQPDSQSEVTSFSASVWNQIVWNHFVWNGATLMPSLVDMGGEGENVSLMISGNSDYNESIRFSGATINYAPRRYLR